MADTVLFVGTGQLVLLMVSLRIFVNGGADNQSCLASAVHGQSIDVEVGSSRSCEDAFCQHVIKVSLPFRIQQGCRVCVPTGGRSISARSICKKE